MKRGISNFILGVVCGAVLCGGGTALAAGVLATPTAEIGQRVTVDGKEVKVEAYNIGGYNYFKLGDLAEQIGFGLAWDEATSTVQIYRDANDVPQPGANPANVVVVPQTDEPLVLKEGDKVLCDDGYIYEITDMSRYNNSMFSSEPVGALPEPTCDWSKFPEPETPKVEVRHFAHDTGDSMFIRNLYETRRMQYTLYNLIGGDPSTWNNGKPLATVILSMDNADEAGMFWPWRSSEIERLFKSRPLSDYSVEAWDYYSKGIFQHTRYLIISD